MLEQARKIVGLDPLVHAPVRLAALSVLAEVGEADFTFLVNALGVTRGNLSAHLLRLVEAAYVDETKGFAGRVPRTTYQLTRRGRGALSSYANSLSAVARRRRAS